MATKDCGRLFDPAHFMKLALDEAKKSTPKPSNYCVGAVLVNEKTGEILSTGYTLELPGNTHAEQCCLQKFATKQNVLEDDVGKSLPPATVLFTTMEPCIERLSGNVPCVDRILRTRGEGETGVCKVYIGVTEPDTFIRQNSGRAKLEQQGVQCIHVPGFEDEILAVATAGHRKTSV